MTVAAFFDMDKTLLRINTGTEFGYYLRKHGHIGWLDLVKTMIWGGLYTFSILDLDALMARLVSDLKGKKEKELQALADDFVNTEVLSSVLPKAQQSLLWHREQGHRLVLLSSALSYTTEPLAAHLGFDAVLCSRLEVQDETLTGRCLMPICFGSGKVYYAEQWAKAEGIDLDRSFFYTDSYSDLPMLLRIGNPRVVNADPRLYFYARKKHWPIERW